MLLDSPEKMDDSDVQPAWNWLGIEAGEMFVLSAVYETAAETPTLMAASLLAGPRAIATGWPSWRLAEGFRPPPSEDEVSIPGTFKIEQNGAIAGRAVMTPDEAYGWLRSVLERRSCPAIGDLPHACAALAPAQAPIMVCTQSESPAGSLATWLPRPVNGFHFPRTDAPAEIEPAETWTIAETEYFSPAINVLGMSWFREKNGPPPSGLLVGRFERRAWLAGQKLDPENELFAISIGLEPERAELADLELEVQERVGEEVIFAEHVRLEDTDLGEVLPMLYAAVSDDKKRQVVVNLPTLGRGIARSVRLTHRDGVLLDERNSMNLAETISFTLTVNGAEQPPVTVGETRDRQDLVGLLGGVERVRKQYVDLRRRGARNRLFEDPSDGWKALRATLERARGELLVLDPFFKDWALLDGLGSPPPRVLLGAGGEDPPTTFVGQVRRWRHDVVPFHDRFFIWDTGGVSVGTSAGTTRHRLFRIVRIGAAEADVLHERFVEWWTDPQAEQIWPARERPSAGAT
jgi:hypothetical protein